MIKLKLDIIGEKSVVRGMDALIQHLGKDLRPMLEAVREWWYSWQSAVFAEEGSELLGRKWQPLSHNYAAWKERHFPGRPILELTGALRDAMTGKGSGAWRKVEKKSMTLGTQGIDYTFAHNFGTDRLPARKFIGSTREALVDLDKRMQDVLADVKRDILREMGGPGGMAR